MEGITRQAGDEGPLRRLREAQRILTDSGRDRARIDRDAALELTRLQNESAKNAAKKTDAKAPSGDRIEISAASSTPDPERQARVAELREHYEAGSLNTRERLEQAAEGLLKSSN